MKKFFIFLSVLIGIVVVAVLVLGTIEPKDVLVSRSVIIKAPRDAVFEQMVVFRNWVNWSPWYKMDSTMKLTYFGDDGQPGSGYSWVGSAKTGAGEMKNEGVTSRKMDFDVNFTEPDKGSAKGVLKAEDSLGFTRATWSFSMHMPFPMNAMGIFMNMDKMLGGDFENGLNNMKRYVESRVEAATSIDVEAVIYPAHVFEGVRQKVGGGEMDQFFMDKALMLKKELGDKINGPAVEILMGWDTAAKQGDIVVAFPVSDTLKPAIKGAQYVNIGESKAYRIVSKGAYSKKPDMHVAIQKYIWGKGQRPALIFEEYPVGPVDQPDTSKWVTNIYYIVK